MNSLGNSYDIFIQSARMNEIDQKHILAKLDVQEMSIYDGLVQAKHHHLAMFFSKQCEKPHYAYLIMLSLALARENGHLYLPVSKLHDFLRDQIELHLSVLKMSLPDKIKVHLAGLFEFLKEQGWQKQCMRLFQGETSPLVFEEQAEARISLRITQAFKEHFSQALWGRMLPGFFQDQKNEGILEQVLAESNFKANAEQRVAILNSLQRRMILILGGPGTGKTSTATTLMRSFILARQCEKKKMTLGLAAPTGRAASRLMESQRQFLTQFSFNPEVDELLPKKAVTLHQLLGIAPGKPFPKKNKGNKLQLDLLIVDETSMADLKTLTWLLEALPRDCHLVLLGDESQLPSIEAGAFLRDLSNVEVNGGKNDLEEKACVVRLRHSHRFQEGSEIAKLAEACAGGKEQAFLSILYADKKHRVHAQEKRLRDELVEQIEPHVAALARMCINIDNAEAILEVMDEQVILSPLRRGSMGSMAINELIDQGREGEYYAGRVILIKENDPETGLFNGDRGVVIVSGGVPVVVFSGIAKGRMTFSPNELPSHETAFAMTVHKSQGSEYKYVYCLLGMSSEKMLTREILFTAITRAREGIRLFSNEEVIKKAINKELVRYSGMDEVFKG